MYLRRNADLSDWEAAQRRLLEQLDKAISQTQLLTDSATVRWTGNPKEYMDYFAVVAERGVGLIPEELTQHFCTAPPPNLHLLITSNGHVK